jgi:two-component SAPR family response regulator
MVYTATIFAVEYIKALEILNKLPADLLFLDIKMPQLSGLDLLKTLRHPPKTILTIAYREFALDGFELGVIDYLLKPITFDRFFKSIERYLNTASMLCQECFHLQKRNLYTSNQGINISRSMCGIFHVLKALRITSMCIPRKK